jgi:hypothetical protein
MIVKKHSPTEPIFTEEDIGRAEHLLVKLLRTIFVKKKITYGVFNERVLEFCENNGIKSQSIITSTKYNYLKIIHNPKTITWKSFEHLLQIICGLGIKEISINCLNLDNIDSNDEIYIAKL